MIPLVLTVEKIAGAADWSANPTDTDWGVASIRLGENEIGQVELTYNEWDDGRDGLERAAARWFTENLGAR